MIVVACDLPSEGESFLPPTFLSPCLRKLSTYVLFSLGPTKWTAHPDHQKRSHEEDR